MIGKGKHDDFIKPIVDYCMTNQEAYPILMQKLAQSFLDEAQKKQEELKEQCSNTEVALHYLAFETHKLKTKKVKDALYLVKSKLDEIIKNKRNFNNWDWFVGKEEK